MTNRSLDLFKVIGQLNRKDVKFYDNLEDKERKELQPFVVMRWMTGTADIQQIVLLNEFVNPYAFNLTNHKQLLVYLLAVSASGNVGRCQWLKYNSKKPIKMPNVVEVLKTLYGYSATDAMQATLLLSDIDIIEQAELLGCQPDTIKLIKKELKTR